MRRKDEGFTLIELLVVIVVIGVLAAISIPTFMKQRAKAFHSAMAADLNAIVTSEAAFGTENFGYTDDVTLLMAEGYKQSKSVTAHLKLVGTDYLACTRHSSAAYWLVYDSSTSSTTKSNLDCV